MKGHVVWRRIGILVGFALLTGVVGSLVWAGASELATWVVQQDGHATITDGEITQRFSADFWFTVVGAVVGLGLGLVAWILLRRIGWPVALVAVLASLLAGLVCLLVAQVFGPGPFPVRVSAARPGDSVSEALRLSSPSALAMWAFTAAMVPLFAASLGPEVDRHDDAGASARDRREAGVDDPGQIRGGELDLEPPAST